MKKRDERTEAMRKLAAGGEERIFAKSDILNTPLDELIDDLAEGLSESDRAFMMEAAPELKERLRPKRFAHSISVARTAKHYAGIYGVDVSQATRAGLVHDWDKCFVGQEVFDRCLELGVELPEGYEHLEAIFHSITGARALAIRFPQLEPEILQAISRHTAGAVEMSPLDMVIFVADMIEPTRTYEALEPLRDLVGEVELAELFARCYEATVLFLASKRRYLHPDTARVWNAWVGESPLKHMKR